MTTLCILWSRLHLGGAKRIARNQYGREELIFIRNPLQFCWFFCAISFCLREFLYVATYKHILQLCVFLLKLTTFLLLRNKLIPMHLQWRHVLCQSPLHIVWLNAHAYHVIVWWQGIYEIHVAVFDVGIQAHNEGAVSFCIGVLACYGEV